jgi:hypothetical protein
MMNRVGRRAIVFVMLAAFIAGTVFAQGGSRGLLERKMWYVDEAGKPSAEILYWVIFLGNYELKINRKIDGEGTVKVNASMGYQFTSSGAIEGNGMGDKGGRLTTYPGMRIRISGNAEEIKLDQIDYIYDYGTKVALQDGRKGDFLIAEGGENLEVKRFQIMIYNNVKGKFGELELVLDKNRDRMPIVGIAFTKEGAAKAAAEPKSSY